MYTQAAPITVPHALPATGPDWLRQIRELGRARFESLGFPTTRQEAWRFTSVEPIIHTAFELATPGQRRVEPADIQPLLPADRDQALLVFVDGWFQPHLSRLASLPVGLTVMSLSDAIEQRGELVQAQLGQHASLDDAFTALNCSFIEHGAFVRIEPGATVEHPVHLLYVATARAHPTVAHPRNLIVAGDASRATIVEHYAALDEGVYWSNAVTEIEVGRAARLAHYFIEADSRRATAISTLAVHQERDSRFESHTALFGGALVRNNIHVNIAGRDAHSLVNGLFVGRGTQHLDNHMRVVHAAEHCQSRQFYKGILADKARGVFTGRIIVKPGAQHTDAKQTNRNLLLSDDAQINTQPQLEIYADDVKCTHGATTGQLDEEALFYLQARGLTRRAARSMLIYAFARESLDRMTDPAIRSRLTNELLAHLPSVVAGDVASFVEL